MFTLLLIITEVNKREGHIFCHFGLCLCFCLSVCACPHCRVLVHELVFFASSITILILKLCVCSVVLVHVLCRGEKTKLYRAYSKRELFQKAASYTFEFPNRDELISQLFESLFMADISAFIFLNRML